MTTPPTPDVSALVARARTRSEALRGPLAMRDTAELIDRLADALEAANAPGWETGGWLPNVLCPTDGVWRVHKLPDESVVVASFDGYSIGEHASRWRVKALAYHNPARPTGEVRGGIERMSAPYNTFVISDLPEGVTPTHFRPNDTVHGRPVE